MENTGLSKHTASYGLSLALTSVANALLVVAKEKSPFVMDGMKKLTSHHWITHSTLMVLLFVGLGWLLARTNGGRGVNITASRLIRTIVSGVVLGGLIIVGFYLTEG